MALTFGLCFPVGFYLVLTAQTRAHRSVQVLGVVVAVAGLLAVLAHVQADGGGDHVSSVHGYVGYALLVLAVLVQPLTILHRAVSVHRRGGQLLVPLGVGNVLLGLTVYDADKSLQVAFAGYVLLLAVGYVVFSPNKQWLLLQRKRERKVKQAVELGPAQDVEELGVPALHQLTRDAVVALSHEGRVVGFNRAAQLMFGYSPADVVGELVYLLFADNLEPVLRQALTERASVAHEANVTVPLPVFGTRQVYCVTKEDVPFPVDVRLSSYVHGDQVCFVVLINDLRGAAGVPQGAVASLAAQPHAHDEDGNNDDGPEVSAVRQRPPDEEITLWQYLDDLEQYQEVDQRIHDAAEALRSMTEEEHFTVESLALILRANLERCRIEFTEQDIEVMAQGILAKADVLKNNRVSMHEMAECLQQYGLTLDETGKFVRQSAGEQHDADNVSWFSMARRAVEDDPAVYFWLFLWGAANVALFAVQYIEYHARDNLSSDWVPIARGAGMCLNFNCAIALVPMLRLTLTWLRTTRLVYYFPLDALHGFHSICGWTIMFFAVVHGGAHYLNYAASDSLGDTVHTDAGFTGNVLALILLAMGASALLRRSHFHLFFAMHHLFIFFYIVLLMHGPGLWSTNFWKFFIVPGVLYAGERIVRARRRDTPVSIVAAHKLSDGVVNLVVAKPPNFEHLPGQYIFIKIPRLSSFEYHPFTLTSAPSERHLSLHVRCVGDWTNALGAQTQAVVNDFVVVDGPYGSASEGVLSRRVAVLVAGGIGATPFGAILKHLRLRLQRRTGCLTPNCGCDCACCQFHLERIYFVWVTRSTKSFGWFGDLLEELHAPGLLDVRTFVTGGTDAAESGIGTLVLELGLDVAREVHGRCMISRAQGSKTEFKRPDWNALFTELSRNHAGEDIGVFYCGPHGLGTVLKRKCRKYSIIGRPTNTTFDFNEEVF